MSYFAFDIGNPEDLAKKYEELKQKVQDLESMCEDKNRTIANLIEEINFLKKTISDIRDANKPSKIEQKRKDKLVQMIDPNYFKILGIKHI